MNTDPKNTTNMSDEEAFAILDSIEMPEEKFVGANNSSENIEKGLSFDFDENEQPRP